VFHGNYIPFLILLLLTAAARSAYVIISIIHGAILRFSFQLLHAIFHPHRCRVRSVGRPKTWKFAKIFAYLLGDY